MDFDSVRFQEKPDALVAAMANFVDDKSVGFDGLYRKSFVSI